MLPPDERARKLEVLVAYAQAHAPPGKHVDHMEGVLRGKTRRADERRDPVRELGEAVAALAAAAELQRVEEALDRQGLGVVASREAELRIYLGVTVAFVGVLGLLMGAAGTVLFFAWVT